MRPHTTTRPHRGPDLRRSCVHSTPRNSTKFFFQSVRGDSAHCWSLRFLMTLIRMLPSSPELFVHLRLRMGPFGRGNIANANSCCCLVCAVLPPVGGGCCALLQISHVWEGVRFVGHSLAFGRQVIDHSGKGVWNTGKILF